MALQQLTERVSAPFAGCRVDRDKGIIYNVLLCGPISANGRDYPEDVRRRDITKYNKVPIGVDHSVSPSVEKTLGWIENPRFEKDSRGDAHLLKSHPLYEQVMEAAERNPHLFGFSHIAMCETLTVRGRMRVESVNEVISVDLVRGPATTKGFFEHRGSAMAFTIKQIAEWVQKNPKADSKQILKIKKLAEMDGMADVPAMDAEPAADAKTEDTVMAAFKAAIMEKIDACMTSGEDPKQCLADIKELLKSHNGIKSKKKDDDTEDEDEPQDDDTNSQVESKKGSAKAIVEALRACDAANFRPDSADLDIIANTPAANRGKVIERLKKTVESAPGGKGKPNTPQSAGRNPGGGIGRNQTPAPAATKVEEQRAIPAWDDPMFSAQ